MKSKEVKSSELVKIAKSSLIALIAPKIKGKNLFPKKVEEGKKILSRARYR